MQQRSLAPVNEWVRQTSAPRAVILLYHRVQNLLSDPQMLSVCPDNFEEHLQVIRNYATCTISELARMLASNDMSQNYVAVTFDDGYADNLSQALPLLEKYGVPASIYVPSGDLGEDEQIFWWDELERLLLYPGRILSSSVELESSDLAEYSVFDFEKYSAWHVELQEDPTARHSTYRRLHNQLKLSSAHVRKRLLEELGKCFEPLSEAQCSFLPLHRRLKISELKSLSASSLIEIGAHSVSHEVLPQLSVEDQQWQTQACKPSLEDLLDRPVSTFAYPYGAWSEPAVRFVGEAGFDSA